MTSAINTFENIFGKQDGDTYEFTSITYLIGVKSIVINWVCRGIGFGQACFIIDPESGFIIDSETMGKDFIKKLIADTNLLIDKGQKALKIKVSEEGFEYVESQDCNEIFIKNTLNTFEMLLDKNTIEIM